MRPQERHWNRPAANKQSAYLVHILSYWSTVITLSSSDVKQISSAHFIDIILQEAFQHYRDAFVYMLRNKLVKCKNRSRFFFLLPLLQIFSFHWTIVLPTWIVVWLMISCTGKKSLSFFWIERFASENVQSTETLTLRIKFTFYFSIVE